MSSSTLLIMAGGTGGHVFPGLAVADDLSAKGWTIHWLGTAERMEAQLVPKYGYPISFIDIKGVRGNGLLRKLSAPFKLIKATWQAWRILRKVKPNAVLGMGGFASGPGGLAARLAGIPLILHEQNAAAGMTNRYLAKVAQAVLLAFPNALPSNAKTSVVGNPLRQSILSLANTSRNNGSDKAYRLLVVGGSLGAQILNQTLPKALALMDEALTVRHQVGKGNLVATETTYAEAGIKLEKSAEVQVSEFIDDISAAYQWADVVLCRAGALTVSELAAVGLPAVFVPLPHAVDDHQTKNAQFLVQANAAKLLIQRELSPERLAEVLTEFTDPTLRQAYAAQSQKQASLDATSKVAAVCQQYEKRS